MFYIKAYVFSISWCTCRHQPGIKRWGERQVDDVFMKLGEGSTEVPNAIFAAIPQMSAAEVLCTLALVRETYGCDRSQVRLTNADFLRLTGIGGKITVKKALQAVEMRGFFRRTDERSTWEVCEPGETGALRPI